MLKNSSKIIGRGVKNGSVLLGNGSNQVLQSIGLKNTGKFVEEQIIDNGESSASNIEVIGQSVDGAVKVAGGYITKNDELKQCGFEDLNEAKSTFVTVQVSNIAGKVEDVTKIGTGIQTRNIRQAKEGAAGLIGLKKSAVGLNILDDFSEFKKV